MGSGVGVGDGRAGSLEMTNDRRLPECFQLSRPWRSLSEPGSIPRPRSSTFFGVLADVLT